MSSNKCCIQDNKDACYSGNMPAGCQKQICNDNLTHNSKFCCSGEATFNAKDRKYKCKPQTPPSKRTCANPGEDVTNSSKFQKTPAPCCDGQKPVNNICPNTPNPPPNPPPPPGNSGGHKTGLKVLLGILIFLWFVTLGMFIYTTYKLRK